MTATQNNPSFPGLPANLKVHIQDKFEGKDALFLKKVWTFYNRESDTKSLINNIEIMQDKPGISIVNMYFHETGCELMQKAFPGGKFIHWHKYEPKNAQFCQLHVTRLDHKVSIKHVLDVLLKTQNFIGDSRSVMESILSMV